MARKPEKKGCWPKNRKIVLKILLKKLQIENKLMPPAIFKKNKNSNKNNNKKNRKKTRLDRQTPKKKQ